MIFTFLHPFFVDIIPTSFLISLAKVDDEEAVKEALRSAWDGFATAMSGAGVIETSDETQGKSIAVQLECHIEL